MAARSRPAPVKPLNSTLLLALSLAAAPCASGSLPGETSPGLQRARHLATPSSAAEYKQAIRELKLIRTRAPGEERPRLEAHSLHTLSFDFVRGEWRDPSGTPLRILATNKDYNIALTERATVPVVAEAAAEAAAGFPGEVIEEVIVPVPSEIFAVMDKLGRPDWRAELRKGKTPTFSNRVDVALLLGSGVAEGFVAVQAEDKDAVERIGKDVLRLSESLGLKDTVLPHTNSILEASKNSHWEIVRVELDKTQKTVRDTMEQRRDAELGQCVSLGGWLRGTDAVTSLIMKNYTADAAELLNQPDIIQHFQKELKKLATRNGKLKDLLDGLGVIAGVIGTGDEAPDAAGVKTIHATADRLVKSITNNTSSAH